MLEILREYTLSLPNVQECTPFGPDNLVYKIGVEDKAKMFLLISIDNNPLTFNAKCEPEYAIELRASYPEHVLPGYHMSKVHWNTVVVDGVLPFDLVKKLIRDAYGLVASKAKKKIV